MQWLKIVLEIDTKVAILGSITIFVLLVKAYFAPTVWRFMKSIILAIAMLAISIPLVFNLGNKETSAKLSIAGSSTLAPLVSELAIAYEKENQGVRIDVQTGGSGRGIRETREGLIHLGMVSRSPKDQETDINWVPIARDGIAVIGHNTNTSKGLSKSQLKNIYLGKTADWTDLAETGLNGKIVVVHKAAGRSTQEVFLKYLQVKNSDINPSIIIGDNQQGIKTVAGNPLALGYVSIGAAEVAMSEGVPIRFIPIDGEVPDTKALKTGSYSIARTLHLVSKTTLDPLARDFILFTKSERVKKLIEGYHFVPLQF